MKSMFYNYFYSLKLEGPCSNVEPRQMFLNDIGRANRFYATKLGSGQLGQTLKF